MQKIGYEFYCKELFMVKHKSKCSCKSAIFFYLDTDIIKENCKFTFNYNKTDITPTVLDGGNEIILANWPDGKHIICSVNNDIQVRIPSHPYVLVNRSALCNCGIEVENSFLLESLAACQDANWKLVKYFMVNTAFVNYLDHISAHLSSAHLEHPHTLHHVGFVLPVAYIPHCVPVQQGTT